MVNMRAYSQDLRDRVIDLHKTSKYRIKAISTLLGIERHIANLGRFLPLLLLLHHENL